LSKPDSLQARLGGSFLTTLYIFDLDGTLLDTIQDLASSVNYALGKHRFPLLEVAQVRSLVGNGIRNLIARSVPEGTDENLTASVFAAFKSHYEKNYAVHTQPYPGIPELLQSLKEKGKKLAVSSNKADPIVQKLCARFFPDFFTCVRGEVEGIPRKPDPASIKLILDHCGADKNSSLYIGDSEVDIKTAENAGIPCLSVTWGFRKEEDLISAGARHLIHHPKEIESPVD